MAHFRKLRLPPSASAPCRGLKAAEKGVGVEGNERWMIRVRWHPYDDAPTRVEWLELPEGATTPGAYADFISSHLREREGLPPDSRKPGERVLWFEWDYIRTADRASF